MFYALHREDFPAECIADCSAPGRDAALCVKHWLARSAHVRDLIGRPTAEALRKHLREYGAWDETELSDDAANRERLLWCVCCDFWEGEDAHYVG